MIKARKANKVVRIPDEKADEYKALGYSLYNEKNEVIYQHMTDAEKIESMEKEIARLTAENEELKKELQEALEKAPEAHSKASGKNTTK